MALWKVHCYSEHRWAVGPVAEGPQKLLPPDVSLDSLLSRPEADLKALTREATGDTVPGSARVVAPIDSQEVWAAGVTYDRSRQAREEESGDQVHYRNVYVAERPELFFKATPSRVRGPHEPIAVRADSHWNVPEPELGVVVNCAGHVVAYLIGNDVSSRSIEGENPLYLPQAKIYDGSCALGPCLVPVGEAPPLADMKITLRVERAGSSVVNDSVPVSNLRRLPEDLSKWLMYAQEFPVGAILLTGTGLIPDNDFTLSSADVVTIGVTGLGELTNKVIAVGEATHQ
ncbi:fumarylacetoacetate hydrolase family protein [Mycolicibacterium sp. XJ870]